MATKVLLAREVRKLPEMSKVTIHSRDKYGHATRLLCFVHELQNGKKVLQSAGLYSDGFIEIVQRRGVVYTVEVDKEGIKC